MGIGTTGFRVLYTNKSTDQRRFENVMRSNHSISTECWCFALIMSPRSEHILYEMSAGIDSRHCLYFSTFTASICGVSDSKHNEMGILSQMVVAAMSCSAAIASEKGGGREGTTRVQVLDCKVLVHCRNIVGHQRFLSKRERRVSRTVRALQRFGGATKDHNLWNPQ